MVLPAPSRLPGLPTRRTSHIAAMPSRLEAIRAACTIASESPIVPSTPDAPPLDPLPCPALGALTRRSPDEVPRTCRQRPQETLEPLDAKRDCGHSKHADARRQRLQATRISLCRRRARDDVEVPSSLHDERRELRPSVVRQSSCREGNDSSPAGAWGRTVTIGQVSGGPTDAHSAPA